MTEQTIQQALMETGATMERQRLLKQLWKLRKASAETSPNATAESANWKMHRDGRKRQSA